MISPKSASLLLLGVLLVAAPGNAASSSAATPATGPLALLSQAQQAAQEWAIPGSGTVSAPELFRRSEKGLRPLLQVHPTDASLREALVTAQMGQSHFAEARQTLTGTARAQPSTRSRQLLTQLRDRASVERWAKGGGGTLIAAEPLPDGRWLAVTAHVTPAIVGDRELAQAKLQLLNPSGPTVIQTIPLIGPENHRAEFGIVTAAPAPEPHATREPVLSAVDLLVRRSGAAVLVYVSQQIHGASWEPTEVRAYRYAAGHLQWTLTAGSRGRPLLRDEDRDGAAELVTFRAVGWTLSTSNPPLWEETLEWDGARWREVNRKFPNRYRPLAALFTTLNQQRPNDPDTLLHLARSLNALGQDAEALNYAGESLRAAAQWSHPQPDAGERVEMANLVRQFFPTAAIPPTAPGS